MPDETSPTPPAGEEPAPAADPDVDEELAALTPPPRRRSPLVAAAVIGLCGLLLAHLVEDTRYALRGRTPIELGDARNLSWVDMGNGSLVDNTHVALSGLPDYRNALLFEPKGDSYRRAFYPMMGTGDQLLVRADETSTRHALDARMVGRLRRFRAVPWADQIRDYYAKRQAMRLLDLEDLRRALVEAQPAAVVRDRAGQRVPIRREQQLVVTLDFPDNLLITLSKDKFPVEEDARHEAERLGAPLGAAREVKDGYTYPAKVEPARRDAFLQVLEGKDVRFALRRETLTVPLAALAATAAGIGGPAIADFVATHKVPGAAAQDYRVVSIELASPIEIPVENAWILVENELPGDFLWAPILDGVLALFLAFNVWLLTRSLRGRKTATR
jgi:hypothetical protein